MSKIDWLSYDNEASLKAALQQMLPETSTLSDVESFCVQQGLQCSAVENNVKLCSAPAKSHLPQVDAKWLLEFHFRGETLTEIKTRTGLIGP